MFADYDQPDGTNSVANIYRKLFVSLVTRGYAEIYKNFFYFCLFLSNGQQLHHRIKNTAKIYV